MEFPETVISTAIEAKTTADQGKLEKALEQLKVEDPSFTAQQNRETGQLLIRGMGELHLEIIVDRLQREFKVGINVGRPQVSYRETITAEAEAAHECVKEVGDAIQRGHCSLRVAPADYQQGVLFESKVSKRDVPHEIQKAIERGVLDTAPGGILAGHAFLNIAVTLLAADYDENEAHQLSYTMAAGQAFQKACREASPIMMEPVMDLEIITPVEYTGDILADLNTRRGKVFEMAPRGVKEAIVAEAPLAEMFGYSTDLRSKSQGRATFTMTFKCYKALTAAQSRELLESKGIYLAP